MQSEFALLIRACILGAGCLLLYDVLRALRSVIVHTEWQRGAEDVLYWIFIGFFLFAQAFCYNDGILRLYLLGGMLLGVFLCRSVISPLFIQALTAILRIPAFFGKKIIKWLILFRESCRIQLYEPVRKGIFCLKIRIKKAMRGRFDGKDTQKKRKKENIV